MRVIFYVMASLWPFTLQAQTLQHGNIIYTLPQNWSAGRVEAGLQTLTYDPPDDICQYCYVYLGAGGPKSGTLIDYVTRMAPLFIDEDDRDTMKVLQAPQMASMGAMNVALMGVLAGGNPYFIFGFEGTNRFDIVAFKGDGGYEGDQIQASTATFQTQVLPMFIALQFVSQGAAPLMPAPVAGELDGVWWGWYSTSSFGIDMMLQMKIDHRRLVFWRDGYFYDGTPPNGVQPLDAVALTAAADGQFGTYVASKDRVTLTFATGEREDLAITGDSGLMDKNRALSQVETLTDGTPLVGEISSFFYSGFTPGAGVEGGISASSETQFFADGTYTGSSFGGAFGNFTDGAGGMTGGFATGGDGHSSGGRYQVKGGLVIQYPADGSPPTASMLIKTSEGLMIDDQFLSAE